MTTNPPFEGFAPTGTTPVPDLLFDELLSELSGPELKVLLYIIRRTKGFKKDQDAISLTQFTDGITTRDGRVLDKGCGITVRSRVIKALASLEKQGYITSEKVVNGESGHGITVYKLRYRSSSESDTPASVENDTTPGVDSDPTSSVGCDTTSSVVFDTHKKQGTTNSSQQTGVQESAPPSSTISSLTEEKKRCWSLWLNVDQNQEVPPDLTPTAEKYLTFFAPRILTQAQMDSLVESTRKSLSKQHKRKIWKVALGNMHTHYPEWKHEQEETSQDQPQDDYCGFKTVIGGRFAASRAAREQVVG